MVKMDAHLKNHISLKFQNGEISLRIIAALLKLEREYPGTFVDTVAWIQILFEKSHLNIGKSTVMGGDDVRGQTDSERILDLDDFMPLRFQNPETGQQLIITLMELEARIEGILYEIMARIDATLEDVISKQGGDQGAPSLAKILPFKGKENL